MKVFTLSEANELIPQTRLRLLRLQKLHAYLQAQKENAQRAAASASKGGGGIAEGGNYVARLLEFSEINHELDEMGIHIKDYERGLIDFPAWREGRIVFLCWILDEGDEIVWWHDMDAGFGGRQPL